MPARLASAQLINVQEQLEQATRDAGLPPDDPLNQDPFGASRKLRARGENNKVAKTAKKKNEIRWNHGYIVRVPQSCPHAPPSRCPAHTRLRVRGARTNLACGHVVGWQFGAIFMRKHGWRIEGGGEGGDGDRVTLRPEMANHDKYAMEMEWDALQRGKAKRTGAPMAERRSVRQRSDKHE